MSELSPAAKAVMIAATNGNANVVNDPVYRQCIAAALRAAADQVVPELTTPWNSTVTPMISARDIRAKFLAIADELEAT